MPDVRLEEVLPPPPPWRDFRGGPLAGEVPPADDGEAVRLIGSEYHLTERDVDSYEVDMVNAALYLRRPLLVTGRPGTGKSALAFRIARELRLGRVLRWPITSHTTLDTGLYNYDAIGRVSERLVAEFIKRSSATGGLPADKLFEAVYLATSGAYNENDAAWGRLVDALWRELRSLVP